MVVQKYIQKRVIVTSMIQLKKGDILLFNSGLKHCTGNNKSKFDRNCITITLIKMYMKPQFDYLKLFTDKELTALDDKIKSINKLL